MENVNKCKFDIGDLVVRCYKDGFKANCIYYKESSKYDHKDYDYIIYLGKSFSRHGGLSRFDSYGMGIDNFVYRLCTISESFEIINNIIKYREMNNNIEIEYFKDSLGVRKMKIKSKSKQMKFFYRDKYEPLEKQLESD